MSGGNVNEVSMAKLKSDPPPFVAAMPDAPPPVAVVIPDDWQDMPAPLNRSIFLTADPSDSGLLCFWRTTREKRKGLKGWEARSFWAGVLSKREIEFEPYCWREAVPGAAVRAVLEDAA